MKASSTEWRLFDPRQTVQTFVIGLAALDGVFALELVYFVAAAFVPFAATASVHVVVVVAADEQHAFEVS